MPHPRATAALVKVYRSLPNDARTATASQLVGRPASAKSLVEAVEAGAIDPELVPHEQARRLLLHHDPRLDAAVAKHWPNAKPASEREKAE